MKETTVEERMQAFRKEGIIDEMTWHIQVRQVGYGQWRVSSRVNGEQFSFLTNDEEEATGEFWGERWNPLAGYGSRRELAEAAVEAGMSVDEYCEKVWSDGANSDNYEPEFEKRRRLAKKLYANYFEEEDE